MKQFVSCKITANSSYLMDIITKDTLVKKAIFGFLIPVFAKYSSYLAKKREHAIANNS